MNVDDIELRDEDDAPWCPFCFVRVGVYCTRWFENRTIRQQFYVCRSCGWKPTPGQNITRYAVPQPKR